MEPVVDLAVGLILMTAAVGFGVLAAKFRMWRRVVVMSLSEAGALLILIKDYEKIETDEAKVARLLKMSPEEVKIELEKGSLMRLIGMKAAGIVATLRTAVPDSDVLFGEYERESERR